MARAVAPENGGAESGLFLITMEAGCGPAFYDASHGGVVICLLPCSE